MSRHFDLQNIKPFSYTGLWVLICLLLLQGCQKKSSIKPDRITDLMDLSVLDKYQFQGKMSFSDGENGGSGQVEWQQQNGLVNARLKAPLGGKSWQITESSGGAVIETSAGEMVYGDSSQQLVSEQLGWQVPWSQLGSWVIGRVSNSDQAQLTWQQNGYVIAEDDWQITYSKLKLYPQGMLPHKMIAKNGNYSIRLVIKKWHW